MKPGNATGKNRCSPRRIYNRPQFNGALAKGLAHATPDATDPIDAAVMRARRLVAAAGIKCPPYKPAEFAPIQRVHTIRYQRMVEEGRLTPDPLGFTIELRDDRAFERKNFTCAHEIAHTFFYDAVPAIKQLRLKVAGGPDPEEEFLCNVGASEMLMPEVSIRTIASDFKPSPSSLQEIARLYQTSLSATVIRILALGIWSARFILWKLDDGTPKALWLAEPGRPLIHYPSISIDNRLNSGVFAAFESSTPTQSAEWLCIQKRFIWSEITTLRLGRTERVLSCIGAANRKQDFGVQSPNQQLKIKLSEECGCNGTGTRLSYRGQQTYATPCLNHAGRA